MYSFFGQAKEAFKGNRNNNLERFDIKIIGRGNGEWIQAVCPLCGDKGGSASFAMNGHLKCHQCGRKMDLFQWTAEKWGITEFEACQRICSEFNISTEIERSRGRMPKKLTPKILQASTMDLWTCEEAKHYRKFLRERGLDDAQLLEQFGVGYIKGKLVFAQYDHDAGGALRDRFRTFGLPKNYGWCGTGPTGGFWPYYDVPKDGIIWVLEGEWDVMTAWMRLRLQEQGIYCFTWTSTGKIPPSMIPKPWIGREAHFLYDNDTYQGTSEPRAPNEKSMRELEARMNKLLSHAAGFASQRCKVFFRSVPIDPMEHWGADLRDWVDKGGRDIAELKPVPLKDLRPKEKAAIEVKFAEVPQYIGKRIKTKAIAATINATAVTVPRTTTINCEQGQHSACGSCLVPSQFYNGVIHWEEHEEILANAILSRDFEAYTRRKLLGVPGRCPRINLERTEGQSGCIWTAALDDEESQGIEIDVISIESPTLSGEVEIDGYVIEHKARNTVMIVAKEIRQLDRAKVDLTPYINDLKMRCPSESNDPEEIDSFLRRRAADLAYNVTKIHGRPELHITHDLLMHSAIGYHHNGMEQRGWVDAGVVGDTRNGKTMVFQMLLHWHGIGKIWAAMGEITKVGLTMGTASTTSGYALKPGLFPKSHKKVLILDEFHVFNTQKDHPILSLQSARDQGRCDSVKISGSRSLPAKVRFLTISNWPSHRGGGRFPCQTFLRLYQKPEVLSRADFMLVVSGDPGRPEHAESRWTRELVQTLIMRAWAMEPDMVDIDDDAWVAAREFVDECAGLMSERIPLFTKEASRYSVIRLAIAIANICFSHRENNHYACRVREAHVIAACRWLRRTWALSKYDLYSEAEMRRNQVTDPLRVEWLLTGDINLHKPEEVASTIEPMLHGFFESELNGITGLEGYDSAKWLAKLIRMNVVARDTSTDSYMTKYEPTAGGELIIRNIIDIADGWPDLFRERRATLDTFHTSNFKGVRLTPLDRPLRDIIDG